jgi:NADPH:quinone reductase-like Zn-dependent oxidoreductase
MKAVRFHEYGDYEVLHVEEVEEPRPGEGEVSLRVKAAGVNPIDWKILHGRVSAGAPLGEPRGLGVDVAGIVEHVGPGVDGFAPGEEVLGQSSTPAYAEVALSRPGMLLRKPPALPWEVAGSVAVVVGTAYATLARLALEPGETLLVLGASGGVGSIATQLAVARGVRVVGTAGPASLERVAALGATPVAYGEGLLERLRQAAPDGVDAVLDASGHGEIVAAVELAGGNARALTIAASQQAHELGVPFHAGGGGELTATALSETLPLIEDGRISFPIAAVYDLGQVGDALRESEHGRPAGKLVVVPD